VELQPPHWLDCARLPRFSRAPPLARRPLAAGLRPRFQVPRELQIRRKGRKGAGNLQSELVQWGSERRLCHQASNSAHHVGW
jgi:hypothetical protein